MCVCEQLLNSVALPLEWRDCNLLMHDDRSVGLRHFCKLLISTAQYVSQYPNLVKFANIALIVPVTSVECERSFSCQNRMKAKHTASF